MSGSIALILDRCIVSNSTDDKDGQFHLPFISGGTAINIDCGGLALGLLNWKDMPVVSF